AARGSSAAVPVFSSVPGAATLTATPRAARSSPPRARGRGHRHHSARWRAITLKQRLAAGRSTLALSKLTPGTTYALRLTIESADGQTSASTATLRVAAPLHAR